MKYLNHLIILFLILVKLKFIKCNNSNLIDEGNRNKNNINLNDDINGNNSTISHLFILSIPDCYVNGVVVEIGKCFNFQSDNCNPTSFMVKADKNILNNYLTTSNGNKNNITKLTNINDDDDNKNNNDLEDIDYYGIVYYDLNCGSGDKEIIEFECKKSKKIKLMGNVKIQCLKEKELLLSSLNLNAFYTPVSSSLSSMDNPKVYDELKPIVPDNSDLNDLYSLTSNSNKLNKNNSITILIVLSIISTILIIF